MYLCIKLQGCHGQGKSLENDFFPGPGKVRELGFESGKFAKVQKVREKSGNFKFFSKLMVFGNVSMS